MAILSIMLAMGSVYQEKKISYSCMCNNGSNEPFGEKLFNFLLLNFQYFVLCHPTPLHSQAFVAMQSIMLAMGSVGQEKLVHVQ